MGTFDQLTKTSDVQLKGTLNGDVLLSSILKNPGVDAHLNIDSFKMNKTLVGNIKIVSSLDNARKPGQCKLKYIEQGAGNA